MWRENMFPRFTPAIITSGPQMASFPYNYFSSLSRACVKVFSHTKKGTKEVILILADKGLDPFIELLKLNINNP